MSVAELNNIEVEVINDWVNEFFTHAGSSLLSNGYKVLVGIEEISCDSDNGQSFSSHLPFVEVSNNCYEILVNISRYTRDYIINIREIIKTVKAPDVLDEKTFELPNEELFKYRVSPVNVIRRIGQLVLKEKEFYSFLNDVAQSLFVGKVFKKYQELSPQKKGD